MITLALSFALAIQPSPTIVGVASVIDGDTIEIHGERIRLFGIDAPESSQVCHEADGADWRCGREAALFLSDRVGRSTVRCDVRGEDRYRRRIAVCRVGRDDLGRVLVRTGLALAYRQYSTDYVADETIAARSRAGLWRGEFIEPWRWRRGERFQTTASQISQANSTDRDCSDFTTWRAAQNFFEASESGDPHRLDRDSDGLACEGLPGFPG